MARFVAFLRGMNLGNRRVRNAELKAEFEQLGFAEVATFRASGNIVFSAGKGSESAFQQRIEAGLDEGLGFEVPVFLRSVAELVAITAEEPFPPERIAASKGKLQVLLLGKRPPAKARDAALALGTDEDSLVIEGRELYWLPSGGISESDLDLKAIDKGLGKGTMRTMGTIEQIVAKYCGD